MSQVPIQPSVGVPAEALTRDYIGQIVTIEVDEHTTLKGRLDRFVIDTGEVVVMSDWGGHPYRTSLSSTVEVTLSGLEPVTVPGESRVTPRLDLDSSDDAA